MENQVKIENKKTGDVLKLTTEEAAKLFNVAKPTVYTYLTRVKCEKVVKPGKGKCFEWTVDDVVIEKVARIMNINKNRNRSSDIVSGPPRPNSLGAFGKKLTEAASEYGVDRLALRACVMNNAYRTGDAESNSGRLDAIIYKVLTTNMADKVSKTPVLPKGWEIRNRIPEDKIDVDVVNLGRTGRVIAPIKAEVQQAKVNFRDIKATGGEPVETVIKPKSNIGIQITGYENKTLAEFVTAFPGIKEALASATILAHVLGNKQALAVKVMTKTEMLESQFPLMETLMEEEQYAVNIYKKFKNGNLLVIAELEDAMPSGEYSFTVDYKKFHPSVIMKACGQLIVERVGDPQFVSSIANFMRTTNEYSRLTLELGQNCRVRNVLLEDENKITLTECPVIVRHSL